MKKLPRRTLVLVPLIVLSAAIGGCGKEAPKTEAQSAGNASAQEIPLNLGTMKIAALSNLYAAEKLGYFKDEGLKVTFTQMDGGSELLTSVSAGKIDIALSTPSSPIQAIDKGFDFRMVMQNEIAAKEGQDTQAAFVNADSPIKRLEDVKGKTVATNTIKNQMWLSFSKILHQHGVEPAEVHYIELPFPSMEDALRNKQVDVAFNVEPFTSKMLANPAYRVISYPATEALPGQPLGAYWASNKWLLAHAAAAQKFVNAMHKANAYLSAHPEETQKIVSEYTGIKLEAIQRMHPVLWDAKVNRDTLQGLLDLMHSYGVTKKDLKVDDIVFSTAMNG